MDLITKFYNFISATAVTDDGLRAITLKSSLENLSIRNLNNVTGKGLEEMPNLKTFNCSFCALIEDEYVLKLVENSNNLKSLKAFCCPFITENFYSAFEKAQKEREIPLNVSLDTEDFEILCKIFSTSEQDEIIRRVCPCCSAPCKAVNNKKNRRQEMTFFFF